MIAYNIYTRPKGKPQAKPKLATTHYNERLAAEAAGRYAIKGLWVSIATHEEEEPNRWD